MSKQQVAIGSKGQNTVATGVKAKAGKDKVAAMRSEFDGIAALFTTTDIEVEKAQATKLAVMLEGAELTHNSDDKRAMFRESLTDAFLAKGATPETTKVRVSEAIKVCVAAFLSVVVKTDKKGTITYRKPHKGERGTSGLVLLAKASGYNTAVTLAGKIKSAYGKTQKGHKTAAEKAAEKEATKVWGKGDTIDAIQKAIKAVNALAGINAPEVRAHLEAAIAGIKGAKPSATKFGKGRALTDSSQVSKAAVLTNKNGKPVVHGSKEWQAMSRGQKAAATRRFHDHAKGQQVQSNQMH